MSFNSSVIALIPLILYYQASTVSSAVHCQEPPILQPNMLFLPFSGDSASKPSPQIIVPDSGMVTFKCSRPGKIKLVGKSEMTCRNGSWDVEFPSCVKTNFIFNLDDKHPPGLEWAVTSGGGGILPNGSLLLLPGSILHLDCLFNRLEGNPEWQWTPTYRRYPAGWAIARGEREKKYRLSIYYAKNQDSGTYSCHTPSSNVNYLTILVQDLKCPQIEGRGLIYQGGMSLRLNSTVSFSCTSGFYLEGPKSATCLASGKWSNVLPTCHVIHCPRLGYSNVLLVKSMDNRVTGKAMFDCQAGYKLIGSRILHCMANGSWDKDFPTCHEIMCALPEVPIGGKIVRSEQESGNLINHTIDSKTYQEHKHFLKEFSWYKIGGTVSFACDAERILIGSSLVFCNHHGQWSRPSPKCVSYCKPVDIPVKGMVSPRLFAYPVGSVILITCQPGFRPAGTDRLLCLTTRRWSAPIPPCVTTYG